MDIKKWWNHGQQQGGVLLCRHIRAKCVCTNIQKWLMKKQYTKTYLYAVQQKHYLLLEYLLSLPTKEERMDDVFLHNHYFYENNDLLMDCIQTQDERLIEIIFHYVPYLFLFLNNGDCEEGGDEGDCESGGVDGEEDIDDIDETIISLVDKMKQYVVNITTHQQEEQHHHPQEQ